MHYKLKIYKMKKYNNNSKVNQNCSFSKIYLKHSLNIFKIKVQMQKMLNQMKYKYHKNRIIMNNINNKYSKKIKINQLIYLQRHINLNL